LTASKIEEERRLALDDLIFEFDKISGGKLKWQRDVIMKIEYQILQGLNFELLVYHPCHSMIAFLHDLSSKETEIDLGSLNDASLKYVYKAYLTDIPLLFPPGVIAMASIYYSFDKQKVIDYIKNRNKDINMSLLLKNFEKIQSIMESVDLKQDSTAAQKKLRAIRKLASEKITKEDKDREDMELSEQKEKRARKDEKNRLQQEEDNRFLLT
jgi:cyclin H